MVYSIGAALAVALTVSIVAGLTVYRSNQAKDAALDEAEQQRTLADRRFVEADQQRKFADQRRNEADEQRDQAELLAATLLMNEGQSLCEQGEIGRGLIRLAQCIVRAPARYADFHDAARSSWAAWRARANTLTSVFEHGGAIKSHVVTARTVVAFSPDGRLLATGGDDGAVRFWNPLTGERIGREIHHNAKVTVVAFGPDPSIVYTASVDKSARRWDVATGKPLGQPILHSGAVEHLVVSHDGSLLATATSNSAHIWDAATGEPRGPVLSHEGSVRSLSFDRAGARLLTTAFGEKQARVWDVRTAQAVMLDSLLEDYPPDSPARGKLTFDHDGRGIVGSTRRGVQLWDAATFRLIARPRAWENWSPYHSLLASADGAVFAGADYSSGPRVADAQRMTLLGQPLHHPDKVAAVACSADGSLVATANRLGEVRVWRLPSRSLGGRLLVQDAGDVTTVSHFRQSAINANGTELITAGALVGQQEVQIRTADAGDLVKTIVACTERESRQAFRTLFRPDGLAVTLLGVHDIAVVRFDGGREILANLQATQSIAAGQLGPRGDIIVASSSGILRAWGVPDGQVKWSRAVQGVSPCNVSISPDGTSVLAGTAEHATQLFDLTNGNPIGPPLEHNDKVFGTGFLPDGETCVCSTYEGALWFWNVNTQQPIGSPVETSQRVPWITVAPDGKTIATRGDKLELQLWDVPSRKSIGNPIPNTSHWKYSPDGSRLLAGDDQTLRIIHLPSRTVTNLKWHARTRLTFASFNSTGRRVVTCEDDEVCIWDADTGGILGHPWKVNGIVSGAQLQAGDETILLHVHRLPRSTVYKWSNSGEMLWKRVFEDSRSWSVGVAAEPAILATAWDDQIVVWDAATGNEHARLTLPEDGNYGPRVVFSQDGSTLLAAADKAAVIWDVAAQAPRSEPLLYPARIRSVGLSADGHRGIVACENAEAYIWSGARCERGPTIKNGRFPNAVAVSPSGQLVADAVDTIVRLWDAATGVGVGSLPDAGGNVAALVFTSDDRIVYVATHEAIQGYSVPLVTRIGPALAPPQKNSLGRHGGVAISSDGTLLHAYETAGTSMLWTIPKAVTVNSDEIVSVTSKITGVRPGENNGIDILDAAAWRQLPQTSE